MQKKRIASSLAMGIMSEVANKIFPLLTIHFAAEHLGVHSFGLSQFAQWLIDLAIFFVVFGYQSWGMIAWRNATPEERPRIFASAVLLRLIHALVAGLLLIAVLSQNQSWNVYQPIVLQSLFVLAASALEGVWAMTAMNLLPFLSGISIVVKTLTLIFIFTFVKGEQDATLYTLIIMAGNAVISLGTFFIVVRRIGWKWPHLSQMVSAFTGAIPYAVSFFLLIGLERFDFSMVEHFAGTAGAGAYAGPLKIAQSIIPIAGMVTTVFFAEMLGVFEPNALMQHLRAGLRVAILILSPIIAGIWFVDTTIVKLIVGEAFTGQARLLSIITTSVMAQMLILAFGNQVLAIRGKMALYNTSMIIGLVVGITCSIFFANSANLAVFAISSAVGRWTAAVLIMIVSMNVLGNYRGILWELLRSSIPALTMAAVLFAIHQENFVANIIVGAVVHIAATLVMFRGSAVKILRRLLPQ